MPNVCDSQTEPYRVLVSWTKAAPAHLAVGQVSGDALVSFLLAAGNNNSQHFLSAFTIGSLIL